MVSRRTIGNVATATATPTSSSIHRKPKGALLQKLRWPGGGTDGTGDGTDGSHGTEAGGGIKDANDYLLWHGPEALARYVETAARPMVVA